MFHKWFLRVLLGLFVALSLVPIAGLLSFVWSAGSSPVQVFTNLLSDGEFQQSVVRSVLVAAFSVFLTVLLLTPTIWYAYLRHPRILKVIEGLSFISFVLPAVVLGLGYVQFFSSGPLPLAGTPDLLPFAMTLLAMPFYTQALLNRLRHSDAKVYHDAARSLGGGNLTSLWRVQLPILKPGILNGAILVFSISVGEFTITQLTTGGSYVTLPIYMQSTFSGDPATGSAVAIVGYLISVITVFLALGVSARRRGKVQC